MKDLYLVDGYNVIFWLPKVFDREDLESSRKKLIDLLEDYGAHNNLEMIVVFDGQGRSNKNRIEKMEKNPAFSNKLGIKNTSEYLAEKEQKK